MGSIEKRLQALEDRADSEVKRRVFIPRSMERLWHAQKNADRVRAGFPPLPNLEYTREDYEDDLKTLDEYIPKMRAEPGWQTEEGRAFLDQGERVTRERIERN